MLTASPDCFSIEAHMSQLLAKKKIRKKNGILSTKNVVRPQGFTGLLKRPEISFLTR